MRRPTPLDASTITPASVLIGRSDQEPDRDLAYAVVANSAGGRLLLERHGRQGFTGRIENFTEHREKLSATIEPLLDGVPDSMRDRMLDDLIGHLDSKWEVCPADGRTCPLCQANRPTSTDPRQ